jgi:hypothetical protein
MPHGLMIALHHQYAMCWMRYWSNQCDRLSACFVQDVEREVAEVQIGDLKIAAQSPVLASYL